MLKGNVSQIPTDDCTEKSLSVKEKLETTLLNGINEKIICAYSSKYDTCQGIVFFRRLMKKLK